MTKRIAATALIGAMLGALAMALANALGANPHALPVPGHKRWSAMSLTAKETYVRANLRHARGAIGFAASHRSLYRPATLAHVLHRHRAIVRKATRNLRAIENKRAARRLDWRLVGGSAYGPMYDPGMGTGGACYDLGAHPWSYAELVNGHGLGGLPCGYRLVVKNPATGRVAVLERSDIGYGQGSTPMPGGGGIAVIDLWQVANEYLGFSGYGSLLVAPAPKGWGLGPR